MPVNARKQVQKSRKWTQNERSMRYVVAVHCYARDLDFPGRAQVELPRSPLLPRAYARST